MIALSGWSAIALGGWSTIALGGLFVLPLPTLCLARALSVGVRLLRLGLVPFRGGTASFGSYRLLVLRVLPCRLVAPRILPGLATLGILTVVSFALGGAAVFSLPGL
jgi:hypothetical protein